MPENPTTWIGDRGKAMLIREAATYLHRWVDLELGAPTEISPYKLINRLEEWADQFDPPHPTEPTGDVVVRDKDGRLWEPVRDSHLWKSRGDARLRDLWCTSWAYLRRDGAPLTVYEAKP